MGIKNIDGFTSSLAPPFKGKNAKFVISSDNGPRIELVLSKIKRPTPYMLVMHTSAGIVSYPLSVSSFRKEENNTHSAGYPDAAMIQTLVAAVVNEMKSATKHSEQPNLKRTVINIIEQAQKRKEFTVENKKELAALVANVRTQARTKINSQPKHIICGGTSLALDDHVPRR